MLDTCGKIKPAFVLQVSSNPRKLAKQKKSISSRFKQFSFFPSPKNAKKSISEPANNPSVSDSNNTKEQQSWSSSTLTIPDPVETSGSGRVSKNVSPLITHSPWQRSILRDFYRQENVSSSQNMDEVAEMLQSHLQKEGVSLDYHHSKGKVVSVIFCNTAIPFSLTSSVLQIDPTYFRSTTVILACFRWI